MEKKNNKLEDINIIKINNIKQKTDDIVENNLKNLVFQIHLQIYILQ